MVFSTIPFSIGSIYKSKILALEKSRFVIIATIGSLITMISAMVILGTVFGIIGLSIAFVLAISVETIILVLLSIKTEKNN